MVNHDPIAERDAELERLRNERPKSRTITLADLIPERIASLARRSEDHEVPVSTPASEAARWARERFDLRMSRLRTSGIRLEDDELAAVACIMSSPIDEPPLDEVHALRLAAVAEIRAREAPLLPPFKETDPLKAARRALRGLREGKLEAPFVMFAGGIGTTKTSAAGHAIASVMGGMAIDAKKLCDVDGSFDREDRALVTRLHAAPVILVDEVKPELIAERKLGRVLSDLVDARRGKGRVTFMSANMLMKDLGRVFTEQAVSRMRGRVDWVKAVGDDLRMKRGS